LEDALNDLQGVAGDTDYRHDSLDDDYTKRTVYVRLTIDNDDGFEAWYGAKYYEKPGTTTTDLMEVLDVDTKYSLTIEKPYLTIVTVNTN